MATYKTYEDLVESPRQDASEKVDFSHGQMFNLPEWVTWWAAKEVWGKATKKDDPKERTIDLRVCGFVMDAPDFWPAGLRGRVGGLAYTFPFTHHKDNNGERHLCVKPFGKDGFLPEATVCPRCDKFFEIREATQGMEQKAAWAKMVAFSQKYSGLVFGYVNGDNKNLRAFEFSDTKPGKGFDKDPTFYQRIVSLCTDKSKPAAMRINPCFYAYDNRAQILRLKFVWITKTVDKKDMSFWQLSEIFKVGAEDGAPSADVDSSIAERIRPWEWMDVKGEQARMLADDGTEAPKAKANLDAMDYAALMAFAMENQMTGVLEEGYDTDETVALRDAIKKEIK